MEGGQVIANYEALLALTARMQEAAVGGDWEQLITLERECQRHIAAIKRADAVATLDEPCRRRKAQIIENVLAHDADIRSRTAAWMEQLQCLMRSNRQEQRLQQAYGGA